MALFGFIVVATILGAIILVFAGPVFGGVLAFGIVVGCLFWGLYMLFDIHKTIHASSPKKDKVQKAYEQYLNERRERLE
ncbi:Uncharacterised protein [Lysinibacillus sphaericus]|nr:Uncharacterised protein [Lysinibacillus sphaericus]